MARPGPGPDGLNCRLRPAGGADDADESLDGGEVALGLAWFAMRPQCRADPRSPVSLSGGRKSGADDPPLLTPPSRSSGWRPGRQCCPRTSTLGLNGGLGQPGSHGRALDALTLVVSAAAAPNPKSSAIFLLPSIQINPHRSDRPVTLAPVSTKEQNHKSVK
jgi:hypothetical protein